MCSSLLAIKIPPAGLLRCFRPADHERCWIFWNRYNWIILEYLAIVYYLFVHREGC